MPGPSLNNKKEESAKSEERRKEKKNDKKNCPSCAPPFSTTSFFPPFLESIFKAMLSRLTRCRSGGKEDLIPLARSALAAARIEAAASLSGGGESAVDVVIVGVGDPSSTSSTTSTAASLSARPFHSRSSSGSGSSISSSARERIDSKQVAMHSRGMLSFSSPSSRHSLPLRRQNPTSCSSSYYFSTAAPSPRKLDDILKLESLREKTGEEIASIWTEVRFCFWEMRTGEERRKSFFRFALTFRFFDFSKGKKNEV